MTSKSTLLSVLLGLLCLGYTNQLTAMPAWYLNPTTKAHPRTTHLLGVGVGNSYEEATSKAQMDIAQQIEVDIRSQSEIKEEEVFTEKSGHHNTTKKSKLRINVQQEIPGIEIVKRESSRNRFYVLCSLNKKRASRQLRQKILLLTDTIQTAIENAKNNTNTNPLYSLKELKKIQKKIDALQTEVHIHNILSTTPYPTTDTFQVENEALEIINNLNLTLLKGDNQTISQGTRPKTPFLIKATYNKKPLKKASLTLAYGNGLKIGNRKTNKKGRLKLTPPIPKLNEENAYLKVHFKTSGLPDRWKQKIRFKNLEIPFTIDTSTAQEIAIELEKNEWITDVRDKLLSFTRKNGFKRNKNSTLTLEAKITSQQTKKMENALALQFMSQIEVTFIVKKDGEIIGELQQNSQGLANTKKKAMVQAIQTLEINQMKLLELVTQ